MDIDLLVNLSGRAWALPILAAMDQGVPGRQAPLVHATGAGRTAFVASIEHLIKLGLVARTTGHGHPLRPEFALTERGLPVAHEATAILNTTPDDRQPLLRRTWTLPVLKLTRHPAPFGTLRAGLPRITDRALSLSLQSLETAGWVRRTIAPDARPLRPLYHAQAEGAAISAVLSTP